MEDGNTLKRPASPSDSVPPCKRKCTANAEDAPGPSSRTTKTPRSTKKNNTPVVWKDIPKEWTHKKCLFLELFPVELLDKITDSESQLELQDHMALAGSCRTLRNAYTDDVWKALLFRAQNWGFAPPVNHIFSIGFEATQQVSSDDKGKADEPGTVAVVSYRDKVVQMVNTQLITKTIAMQTFKISEKDMSPLKFEQKRNPHICRSGSTMKLYIKAQVRALALRIHGGPLGHAAHIKKRAEIAEKSKATKVKNGTAPKKKAPTARSTLNATILSATILNAMIFDVYDNDYEVDTEYEYQDYGPYY